MKKREKKGKYGIYKRSKDMTEVHRGTLIMAYGYEIGHVVWVTKHFLLCFIDWHRGVNAYVDGYLTEEIAPGVSVTMYKEGYNIRNIDKIWPVFDFDKDS